MDPEYLSKETMCLLADNTLGDEDKQIAIGHIKHCSDCKRTLEQFMKINELLQELFEATLEACPSEDELFDFFQGNGNASTKEHVAGCVVCSCKIETVNNILAEYGDDTQLS